LHDVRPGLFQPVIDGINARLIQNFPPEISIAISGQFRAEMAGYIASLFLTNGITAGGLVGYFIDLLV
jgi:hypothetical protein